MKSKNKISNFFKPLFEKHKEMESFFFVIHDLADGLYLADEDSGINGERWDDLADEEMYNSSFKIQEAIKILKESKNVDDDIVQKLNNIVKELQTKADDSNPLIKVHDDVWSDDNREKLTKLIKKDLEKKIPWRYVNYCICTVNRDGTVEIEEQK